MLELLQLTAAIVAACYSCNCIRQLLPASACESCCIWIGARWPAHSLHREPAILFEVQPGGDYSVFAREEFGRRYSYSS